ncbi:MAG TPA: 16S rRNA (cytosine(1402)-N(4))-methyltransferase RsmH [Candidatus Saccharimonadales bacterium]|nr:16S rRNA (cytosine(1402)-N(4))-methyltransferase RsmH [Candidatus Saccharimonadales bacterium]
MQKQKHQNKQCIVDARMHQEDTKSPEHIPVLLKQTVQYLHPREGDRYLDLTGGYGGHASAVLGMTKNPKGAVLVDRDPEAVKSLGQRFKGTGVEIIHKDFLSASQKLAAEGEQFELILADLGVSSPHLNQASRGFYIQKDGPLDMRMDTTQELTAEMVINSYSEAELAEILKTYGEEPKARAISKLIVRERPIKTTSELATLVAKAWPGHSKVHPATRTFQALRVAVNNELELLRHGLPIWIEQLLAPGGRIAIISFHSLEDRIVKQAFLEYGGDRYDATLQLLTKHPVSGEESEIVFNPRARSAKLRAAAKQK